MTQAIAQKHAALLNDAFAQLQIGKIDQAITLAEKIPNSSPHIVDTQHLLALAHKENNNITAATKYFQRCLKSSPRNPQILTNFGNMLSNNNDISEAIRHFQLAEKAQPDFVNAWYGHGMALLKINKPPEAVSALLTALKLAPENSDIWRALAIAKKADGNLYESNLAYENSVFHNPKNAAAWIGYANVSRAIGSIDKAKEHLQKAEDIGGGGAELLDSQGAVMLDEGKVDAAIQTFEKLCTRFPTYISGHDTLAHVLFQHRPEQDPTRSFLDTIALHPQIPELKWGLIRLLLTLEKWEEALSWINQFEPIDTNPSLMNAKAIIMAELGEPEQALALYEKVVAINPSNLENRISYSRFLLKQKDPERAARQAEEATKISPHDQNAWAFLGTAWRETGDKREDWLFQYDDFIKPIYLDTPKEYKSREDFIDAIVGVLNPMHTSMVEPMDQTLRGGTQTSGNLLGHSEPTIHALSKAIARTVKQYVSELPDDPDHPFLGRKAPGIFYAGSWSVRLQSAGRHITHIHSEGWMSSALYLMLPPSVGPDTPGKPGWIQFGQPPKDLGLDQPPRVQVQPKVGLLALFPSYMWHGTIPFEDDHPRMTVAFDGVPHHE